MTIEERLEQIEKKLDKVLELLGHGGPKSRHQMQRELDEMIRKIEARKERANGKLKVARRA